MTVFFLVEVLDKVLNYNVPLPHRHAIEVLAKLKYLLFCNAAAFYDNDVLKLLLAMVF